MGCIHQHTVLASYRLDRNGKLVKLLHSLIKVVYFKGRKWISKTVYCISFSMVCKIVFCSVFPDIRDNAGKVTRRRRRRTQAIAKRYAFHVNAKIIPRKYSFCNSYSVTGVLTFIKINKCSNQYCPINRYLRNLLNPKITVLSIV